MNPSPNNEQKDDSYELNPFFDLSMDLLCIAGYDGYFKRINPAVSKLLGYTEKELFARPINEFVYYADQHITEQHRANLRKSIPLLNFENRYVTKGDDIVWLQWTSMPLPEKRVIYAIAKNITHKKQLEEERNRLLTKVTNANKDLQQLTYSTSHDLRSPVNNILALFKMLDLKKIEDTETKQLIELLKHSTESLHNNINDYVDAIGVQEGLQVNMVELDLTVTLSKVRNGLKSLIQESGTTFNLNFTAAKKVRFHRPYLESIFMNLISNSIKYARPGHAPVISINTRKLINATQLLFTDNGLGFDMEKVKDRIFGLHQRFHNHPDSKGIGLYLIYNHITSLGGQIMVESKVNEGTTFIISFPD